MKGLVLPAVCDSHSPPGWANLYCLAMCLVRSPSSSCLSISVVCVVLIRERYSALIDQQFVLHALPLLQTDYSSLEDSIFDDLN